MMGGLPVKGYKLTNIQYNMLKLIMVNLFIFCFTIIYLYVKSQDLISYNILNYYNIKSSIMHFVGFLIVLCVILTIYFLIKLIQLPSDFPKKVINLVLVCVMLICNIFVGAYGFNSLDSFNQQGYIHEGKVITKDIDKLGYYVTLQDQRNKGFVVKVHCSMTEYNLLQTDFRYTSIRYTFSEKLDTAILQDAYITPGSIEESPPK